VYKAKLCSFVIAGIVGFLSLSPVTAIAAETDTNTASVSETGKDKDGNQSAFEEKMRKAQEKWKTLTDKQKEEVYSLLESEMKSKFKVMDKLVELGVMDKKDAESFQAHMKEHYDKLKTNGEFPSLKPRRNKNRQ
jgi:primosomal protein N'